MKAKIKLGKEYLFCSGYSNKWDLKDDMIINFNNRYTYISFYQEENRLIIYTTEGCVKIIFTSEVPVLKFDHFTKDQLVLKIINKT